MSSRVITKEGRTEYNQAVIEAQVADETGTRVATEARSLTGGESQSSVQAQKTNIGAVVSFTVRIRNRTPLTGGTGGTSC